MQAPESFGATWAYLLIYVVVLCCCFVWGVGVVFVTFGANFQ